LSRGGNRLKLQLDRDSKPVRRGGARVLVAVEFLTHCEGVAALQELAARLGAPVSEVRLSLVVVAADVTAAERPDGH
jgi:hypothetical protein